MKYNSVIFRSMTWTMNVRPVRKIERKTETETRKERQREREEQRK